MKILFAADGSKFTKKALAFLATHQNLAGPEDQVRSEERRGGEQFK